MESHKEAVSALSARVRQFHTTGQKFRIYHGSTNSTRRGRWKRDQVVDTSGLHHVIEVDTERRIAKVEPNVPMDALVEATLKHGLVPPVVPEFPGITVGGAVVGTAGESSSFKYGFVDENLEAVEVVTADGKVVNASREENRDLFDGIASSFGTLGVLTLVEMRLVEAKRFVRLTYHPIASFEEGVTRTVEFTKDPSIDFIDGVLYGRKKGVVMTGVFTDEDGRANGSSSIRRFSRAHDQWFYIHARRTLSSRRGPATDIIPLTDYLFRYDRGAFWTGRYAYKYFVAPFDRFSRWVLDYFMHTRVLYHALHESGMSNYYLIQDLALPLGGVEKFLDFVDRELGIYPLWICPLKQRPSGVMSPRVRHSRKTELDAENGCKPSSSSSESADDVKPEMMLNVGVWGPGSRKRDEFIAMNRKLEKMVTDLGGIKWLYAQTYYTEEEFWQIYDRGSYDSLRTKYGASAMPTVYDKVKLDIDAERKAREEESTSMKLRNSLKEVWPVRGLYGAWRAMVGKEYLLEKEKGT